MSTWNFSRRRRLLLLVAVLALCVGVFLLAPGRVRSLVEAGTIKHVQGDRLDSLNGVVVFCNGGFSGNCGRNVVDGYNLGLKYQCVEFVKRYYFERFRHRMPDSYGNAKDLFDTTLADGALNTKRGLLQFRNGSTISPRPEDLIILDGWRGNPFGHVAIISQMHDGEVELVQQNTGSTRTTYDLDLIDGHWRIGSDRVLGWLRMP